MVYSNRTIRSINSPRRQAPPGYQAPRARVPVELQAGECVACAEDRAAHEYTALVAGHFLCTECLRGVARAAFDDNNAHPRCPQQGCDWRMDERDINAIAQGNQQFLDRSQH